MTRHIESVAFAPDGSVQVVYTELPGDMRGRGALTQTHVLTVSNVEPYRDDLGLLLESVEGLLDFALHNFAELPPDVPVEPDDEDEELGFDPIPARLVDKQE